MQTRRTLLIGASAAGLLLAGVLPVQARSEAPRGVTTALDTALAAAEASLRAGKPQLAQGHYRKAVPEGWLLLGGLNLADGRPRDARDAYRAAHLAAPERRDALEALALADLYVGEPAEAVQLLTPLANNDPRDVRTRRSLAQALAAAGQPEKAVQRLEEAHRAAPADAEVAYALATGYLRVKKVAAAEPLFASIVAQRPLAQTHVLIGRAYRDAGEFERARAELRRALKLDPGVRRAHYYLGTSIVQEAEDASRLDDAIREFRAELTLAPGDPLANLQLGMALVETRRLQEALPALELAARSGAEARAFYYLGRCQLGLDRPADAAVTLGRALELAQAQGASEAQIGSLQNQLGRAFRATGQTEKAAPHFAEAERLAARHLDSAREDLARYLASATDETKGATLAPTPDDSPFAALPQATRDELRRRTTAALARAYLNLGVMEAQAQRFDGAAELFEKAAAVDPDFPQVQHSLGVARFNAKQFDKAAEPLSRALASNPNDSSLKRMLALTWLDTRAYEKAAELLRDDPERRTNPSLEFSYGLALVHSNRVAEAEAIFSRLLAQHGDSAEINVVLGQAHAQEGDFERAVQFLTRALALKPGVAEANASLGVIYLKQGRLDEAEKALRGELAVTPTDVKSQQNLAVVLEMAQRPEEAIPLLRSVLQSKPDFTDARYLLGKILLAKGAAGEALEQLEAAVKAAPQDANIHYQLGRAYQTLGRTELAQQEFEVFRQLKEKR